MSWLPRFTVSGWCSCWSDAEYEGWSIELRWRSIIIEIAIGKVGRHLEPPAELDVSTPKWILGDASNRFRFKLRPDEEADDAG